MPIQTLPIQTLPILGWHAADILASAMLAPRRPVPEISITFDPATRCYGFSTRLPGMRPHWMIDTFTSLEDVMRWSIRGGNACGSCPPSRVEIYSLSNWYKLSVRSIHAMDVNGKLVAHTVEIGAATAAKQTAKH